MIDTVDIMCLINEDIYNGLKFKSVVRTGYDYSQDVLMYEFLDNKVLGSYNSNLIVNIGRASKYYIDDPQNPFYIRVVGSYHKFSKGYNSHNGFYDVEEVSKGMISAVEQKYEIRLPLFENWLLYRIDISRVYNLENQENVKYYINSLSRCQYSRRKVEFHSNESLNVPGGTSTLKIYNKLLEFNANTKKHFKGTDFNLIDYQDTIKGFCRFECEIHKRKLEDIFKSKLIYVKDVKYKILENYWSDEFMKLLKCIESDLEIVRCFEDVRNRLFAKYGKRKAKVLNAFYREVQSVGLDVVRKEYIETGISSFYRNVKELKAARC